MIASILKVWRRMWRKRDPVADGLREGMRLRQERERMINEALRRALAPDPKDEPPAPRR